MFWTQDRCPDLSSALHRRCLGKGPGRPDQASKSFQIALFYLPAWTHFYSLKEQRAQVYYTRLIKYHAPNHSLQCRTVSPIAKPAEAVAVCSCTQLSRSANIPAHFYKFWPDTSKAQAFQMRYWHCIVLHGHKKKARMTYNLSKLFTHKSVSIAKLLLETNKASSCSSTPPASLLTFSVTKTLIRVFQELGLLLVICLFSQKEELNREMESPKLEPRMQSQLAKHPEERTD